MTSSDVLRTLVSLGLLLVPLATAAQEPEEESLESSGFQAAPEAGEAGSASGARSPASARLHELFAQEWEWRLRENPLFATSVGRNDYDHLLPTVSEEDEARRARVSEGFLEQLALVDSAQLGEADRVSYRIFERQLRERLEDYEFRGHLMPLLADSGFHTDLAQLPREMSLQTARDYDAYMDRLRAFPRYFEQQTVMLRQALKEGLTLPRVVLEGYEVSIASHVVEDPEASVFYEPFREFPAPVAATAHDRLRRQGRAVIEGSVVPAYAAFLKFMTSTYVPGARQTLGASELPRGREYYAQRIRHFTTLDVTADEVHALGLQEVARIRREMEAILVGVGFEGDFAAFLQTLRTDPRFYPQTAEELLKEASYLAKKMDGKLPSLFKTLPRQPYGIAPVPDHIAPKYTAGRYVGSFPGSTQPGYYWVNTHALESRPLYALPALTLHEAVPGHHLQIALAQELTGLPDFRRFSYVNAFGEGWGLYSEWLGIEAGMYPDPYSNFGRLTYEMWRACRLVVDTGLHSKGWSRQQALDYLAGNTALSLHEVRTEIDRYISWPGQALAYKMGELKIRELRHRAEQALGSDFDVREFHDAVLRNGSVPLDVLEEVVEGFIQKK